MNLRLALLETFPSPGISSDLLLNICPKIRVLLVFSLLFRPRPSRDGGPGKGEGSSRREVIDVKDETFYREKVYIECEEGWRTCIASRTR
jgi:hypothetical protein